MAHSILVTHLHSTHAIVMALVVFACPGTTAAQVELPDTPVARRLADFIAAVNDGNDESFLKEGFTEQDAASIRKRQVNNRRVRQATGGIEVAKVIEAADNAIAVVCTTNAGPRVRLSIVIEPNAPHRISEVHLRPSRGEEPSGASAAKPLTPKVREAVVAQLAEALRSKYVLTDIAAEMAQAVEQALQAGNYDDIGDENALAKRLTEDLHAVRPDKHLSVRAIPMPKQSPRRGMAARGSTALGNHGFVAAKVLPGGIGYLKIDAFSASKEAESTAAAAMAFLANSRALIFDLREHGGGSAHMVYFLSGYLFDSPVHLNTFYHRPKDETTEMWSREGVPGSKFSQTVPVYVLTSSFTFSGGEEFAYDLKHLGRATVVGERTGGGAHPAMPVGLGERFSMSMPFARAIHPKTETNWEGVGVVPDVEVEADGALQKAIELATEALNGSK